MNENPGGTPNPLNPNPLDSNPSESMVQAGGNPVQNEPIQKQPIQPASQTLTEELVEESVMVESLDPEGRPMEKVAESPAPKKKKKTGLIIGMIVCLFIAVGCGVAALLIFMNGDKDPVSAAMKKLMSGNTPSNVVIDGDIEFLVNDAASPISKINIDLDTQTKTNSLTNSAEANVTITLVDDTELEFGFSEVYNEDQDLYFKIHGISSLIEQINMLQALSNSRTTTVLDCMDAQSGNVNCLDIKELDCEATGNCNLTDYMITDIDAIAGQGGLDDMFGMLSGVVSVIDGEWLKISVDELALLSDNTTVDSDLSCMIDFVDSINKKSNSAAELYNKNPFLGSTTEGIKINSKFNPVNKITIDDEAFANFVNSVNNSNLTSELYDCLGLDGNVEVSASDVAEIVEQIPAIYVEVDKDKNFSRLYMQYAANDDASTVTIDLSFSYPSDINISAPEEYTTFEQIIQTIFMSMYDLNDDTAIRGLTIQSN